MLHGPGSNAAFKVRLNHRLLIVIAATFLYCIRLAANEVQSGTPSLITPDSLTQLASEVCSAGEATAEVIEPYLNRDIELITEPVRFRQTEIGSRVRVTENSHLLLDIQLLQPPGRPPQTIVTSYLDNSSATDDKPAIRLSLSDVCIITSAHQLVYNAAHSPLYVEALSVSEDGTALKPTDDVQWINPELPTLTTTDINAVRVALVDSGVNYQLPDIAKGLATDEQGHLLGFDFWDMDALPFDANPARSAFFVQRHGTRTASIVLREAPGVALVPYRYPRNAMHRMTNLIKHASDLGVRVIGMPLGSNTYKDWVSFEHAAIQHPDILFVVSAGNNGRDIDRQAVYPAAMDIDNMLVVTSADDFIHPAERTNYGRMSVDYLVPAEALNAMDFNGDEIKVSGSSYAVARAVALAARFLQHKPEQSTTELMDSIRSLSVRARTARFAAIGYLGDPLARVDDQSPQLITHDLQFSPVPGATIVMPLQLIRLDPRWRDDDLREAIARTNTIYEQCGISLTVDSVISLQGDDYLQDLSSGNALTLSRALNQLDGENSGAVRVFFARDTNMLQAYDANAFGIGNTRNRPWMTNSLWLTQALRTDEYDDTHLAMAHELFHIAANSGEHTKEPGNLMQVRTDANNVQLTAAQCATAVETGLANQVLTRP